MRKVDHYKIIFFFNDCMQKLVKEKKIQRLVILKLKNVSFIYVNFVRRCRYSYNTGIQYGFFRQKKIKYFVVCKDDDHKINPLCIIFLKASAYVKGYDGETKWMYFFVKDDELLEKYNSIWNKVNNRIKEKLDCEPIYNNIFFKIKIRSYGDEATDLHDKETPKEGYDQVK